MIPSLFILVCEDNTYNLLVQRNYFQKQFLIVFLQKCVRQICSKLTGGEPYGNAISKCCVARLYGCSIVNLLRLCRTPFWKNTFAALLLYFISFVLVQVINNTFFLYYGIFFEIISQLFAVMEAPVIFLFQSLVKQMPVVIAEAVLRRCSSKRNIWCISVVNVKRNNFVNNGQMSRRHFCFILFSFNQNLNSRKYDA